MRSAVRRFIIALPLLLSVAHATTPPPVRHAGETIPEDEWNWVVAQAGGVTNAAAPPYNAKCDGSTDNATAFAAVAAAVNAGTAAPTVVFPNGECRYSNTPTFTVPVTLRGSLGTVLNHTGTGNAMDFGPAGLVYATRQDGPYVIEGLTWTGANGTSHGLYFNTFLTKITIRNNRFTEFGNGTGYALFFQSQNWSIHVIDNVAWNPSSVTKNFLRVRGKSAGGVTDSGQSHLTLSRNLIWYGGASGTAGVAIWTTGVNSFISDNQITGWQPSIRVAGGDPGMRTKIVGNYFEQYGSGGVIEYGDPATGPDADNPTNWTEYLTIRDCYVNTHDSSSEGGSSYFLAPTPTAGTDMGLNYADVDRVQLVNYGATKEAIRTNNVVGTANKVTRVTGYGSGGVTTAGGVRETWAPGPQVDSAASDIAGLRTDLNALLAKLRAAGVLAP